MQLVREPLGGKEALLICLLFWVVEANRGGL